MSMPKLRNDNMFGKTKSIYNDFESTNFFSLQNTKNLQNLVEFGC